MILLLCCNDRYGRVERLCAVDFGDDSAAKLEAIQEDGHAIRLTKQQIRISGVPFRARHLRSCVGNVFWEGFDIEPDEAGRLLAWLRDTRHWNLVESSESIARWWDSRIIADATWIASQLAPAVIRAGEES